MASTGGTGAGSGGRAHRAGRRRRRAVPAVVIGLVVLVAAAIVWHTTRAASSATRPGPSGRATLRSASPTPAAASAHLPVLGPSMAVEADDRALNDIGDPYVLPVPAGTVGMTRPGYALYWTTDWTANVPTAVSTDLVHWTRVPDALPTLPRWATIVHPPGGWGAAAGVSTMTWGPTVEPLDGHWVLYYSTEDAASGRECLGAATGRSPVGPFVDGSTAPVVCQADLGGDIDPSVVDGPGGSRDLIWKNDGNAIGAPVGIWEQPLAPDGLSVTGAPTRLLGADQAWEHGIIEGPAMLADTRGGWWLFFSGGTWQSDTYDTGVAWCATPAGPCREPIDRPLLTSTPTAVSPGGLDTFVAHDGRLWASYSAFPSAPADARAAFASPRVLELAPVLSH